MPRKSKLSPKERLAQIQALEAQLQHEVAMEAHSDSPAIRFLQGKFDEAVLGSRKAAIAFSNGNNNVDFKLASNEAKREQYLAEKEYATALKTSAEEQKTAIERIIGEFSERRTELGDDISEDEDNNLAREAMEAYQEVLDSNPLLGELETLYQAMEEAKANYKAIRANYFQETE